MYARQREMKDKLERQRGEPDENDRFFSKKRLICQIMNLDVSGTEHQRLFKLRKHAPFEYVSRFFMLSLPFGD